MKPKNYTYNEIVNSSKVGLEFEFYTKIEDKLLIKELSSMLERKVVTLLSAPAVGERPNTVHESPISVTSSVFKLEPNLVGGGDMYKLVTGMMEYKDARFIIIKMMDWIDRFGYTNDKCSIHANISFNFDKISTLSTIERVDVLKFVLSFDENYIYERFPTREKSVYARSIKTIIPNKFFFYRSVPNDSVIQASVILPKEKFYGVNFTTKDKGYLEFRYIGGENYEKKPTKILDVVNHYVVSFYNVLNSTSYTPNEKDKLEKIFKRHAKLVETMYDCDTFIKEFPDIKLSVDLKGDEQVIKTFWEEVKPKLFSLIVDSGLTAGNFNYDTDTAKFQLAKAKLSNARVDGFDLVHCEIEGIISNCSLYYCDVKESQVKDSKAYRSNTFTHCKIEEVDLFASNKCVNSNIDNKTSIINCEVQGGVIQNGDVGAMGKTSDDVIYVKAEEEKKSKEFKKKAVVKDWKWIKNMKRES